MRGGRRAAVAAGLLAAMLIVGGAAVGAFLTSSYAPSPLSSPSGSPATGWSPLSEMLLDAVAPVDPGALAVGPHGELYVADDALNEILGMISAGRFVVVAGDGTQGFAGDGAPAVDAELNDPGGMVVAPDGTLYVADTGNGRVRRISPDGIITTVAGDGRSSRVGVTNGQAALDAHLDWSVDVTLGPGGDLYIADETLDQVLRLGAGGRLYVVAGPARPRYYGVAGVGAPAPDASPDGPDGIAADRSGDLFVAGFDSKALLMVDRGGVMRSVASGFYPRGPGGLAVAPGGVVYAMDDQDIEVVRPQGAAVVYSFPYHLFGGFQPNGIAVSPGGVVYADTNGIDGFSPVPMIVAVRPGGRVQLLWRG